MTTTSTAYIAMTPTGTILAKKNSKIACIRSARKDCRDAQKQGCIIAEFNVFENEALIETHTADNFAENWKIKK